MPKGVGYGRGKRRPPNPIRKRGKKGSGKELIRRSGGGRKILRTWRSLNLSKSARKGIKKRYGDDLTAFIRRTRTSRAARGLSPTTGRKRKTYARLFTTRAKAQRKGQSKRVASLTRRMEKRRKAAR